MGRRTIEHLRWWIIGLVMLGTSVHRTTQWVVSVLGDGAAGPVFGDRQRAIGTRSVEAVEVWAEILDIAEVPAEVAIGARDIG